jgi:hypothetical protein
MDCYKAGWMNNMSVKDTYEQVYHLRRLLSRASRVGDREGVRVYARMIQGYIINEPKIAFAALAAHVSAKVA